MAVGFYAIAYGQSMLVSEDLGVLIEDLQTKDKEMFDPRKCSKYGSIKQDEAVSDFKNTESDKRLVGCFCYQVVAKIDSIEKLEQLKFEGMEQNICLIWLKNYLFE